MSTLTVADRLHGAPSLTRFWACLGGVCMTLAVAGFILAQRFEFPADIAVPVVAAFCWQAALYCAAVSRPVRDSVCSALSPFALAGGLVAVSVAPYVIYSVPTGLFAPESLARLVLLCACVTLPYVLFPVSRQRFAWQDLVVACALAYPMISGLSPMFREIYQGFDPPAHRLDALGKLMLIPMGLYVFLGLRKLHGTAFRLLPRRQDWRPALDSATYSLPWIVIVGLSTGYLRWDPPLVDPLGAIAGAAGKLLGIYFTTALAEEFLMRGVVQNLLAASLGRPLIAQGVAAVLFGAVHLGRGAFPNWGYAATAAVLGWFCGRAYLKSGSVTPAMITHALAVAGQELFFE
ncbi:MAG: CPBP family intramembrane metalloprotease [Acidobacteriia bacterium]|nr:CPBP family intramembrane metalloprotease [Terriglobia bacterium]MYG02701.1 CPBP family intramembrane metalloprotease [Terriglobia bacterium]MYK08142.1 CPBP family intramembrane metalloprotease [Terriglobia bacterium]